MYKISIIVPVYNCEKYLEEALNSIEQQTMNFKEIEVIVVSDGSTDGTDEIIKKFIKNKENCKFIRNEVPSGSAGKPRNIGIENATGKYLMFLDADDFFEKDAFENMYNAIDNSEYEFITVNYKLVDKFGKETNKCGFDAISSSKELTLDDFSDKSIYCNGAVWNKIFRTEFIKKNNIKCLEGLNAEDLYFTVCSFLESKKAMYIPNIVSVNYREVENSASRDISYSYFKKINKGYEFIYDKCQEYERDDVAKIYLGEAKVFFLENLISSKRIDKEQFLELLNDMNWYFKFVQDFKFGNESKESQKIIKLLVDKDYKKLLIERNKVQQEELEL